MIYEKINDFCKVRNLGNCFKNGVEPTPRVKFLMDLLDSEGIEYELDVFERNSPRNESVDRPVNRPRLRDFQTFRKEKTESKEIIQQPVNKFFNIIMRGSSNRMVVAHHDVQNPTTDNANDNSASVINVIATKKLRPEINAVLLDGEEVGGIGSNRLGLQIKNGDFGNIEWVLNYELTGKGGKYFFIGNYPGPLFDKVKDLFDCPVVSTPFNDAVILRKHGIDSIVINPIPPLTNDKTSQVQAPDGKYLDFSMLFNCHSPKDTLSTISTSDMKEFVEEVVLKILDS